MVWRTKSCNVLPSEGQPNPSTNAQYKKHCAKTLPHVMNHIYYAFQTIFTSSLPVWNYLEKVTWRRRVGIFWIIIIINIFDAKYWSKVHNHDVRLGK